MLLTLGTASTCPDCALKNSGGMIEPQTVTAKIAFSSSTLFLLGTFLAVIGFMIWIMIKTSREISEERPLSSSLEA